MPLDIAAVDPFDDDDVDRWWTAYAEAERADRGPDATVWTLGESRSELQPDSSVAERRAHLLRSGGAVVGSASLALPRKDNTHQAHLAISIPPAHRRRGLGTAALAFLEAEAVTSARTTALATVSWPDALGTGGDGSPGLEFARRHGYALALGDVRSTLALPVAVDAPDVRGYTLRSWSGPVPAEHLDGWAVLDASLETEAPTGDLDLEAARPDTAGIREHEELLVAQNRTSYGTVAVDTDGEVAAYTQIVVSGDDGNAYQWGTLVRRQDRGHRLGAAIKIANLRMLQRESPGTRLVHTSNADSNAHMLAINVELGFRPTERMGELQRRLG
ncbi:GNAT family N-acetyltransferase [Microbacterium sp.]|uniref:GNAT family N-acetyltransferase n=1 Tax=Microbacterium sp. TaxID=51671 RepID=UPI0039E3DBE5